MKIYALKSCDTCRKAIRSLQAAGLEPTVVDVRKDGVPPKDLGRFYEAFGDKLINKRSTTWRNLIESERIIDPLILLADHPTLMKRPVIEHAGQLYLGWDAKVQAALLG
ncbi:MAG: arsenate reductase family protein [Paracoccaceae bacterium]